MTHATRLKPTLPTDFMIDPGVLKTPVPIIWEMFKKKPDTTPTYHRHVRKVRMSADVKQKRDLDLPHSPED